MQLLVNELKVCGETIFNEKIIKKSLEPCLLDLIMLLLWLKKLRSW